VQTLGEDSIDKALTALGSAARRSMRRWSSPAARRRSAGDDRQPRSGQPVSTARSMHCGDRVAGEPFVYLVALAQPQRYSLSTLVEDSTVDLPQQGGARWQPQNDDHGRMAT